MDERSPAEVYALGIGLALALAGTAGFFYSASFSSGEGLDREALLGVLDMNGWHNLVYIGSGVTGLVAAASLAAARVYALAIGALYLALTVLGVLAGAGGEIAGLIPASAAGNVLHGLVAIAGVGAGLATPARRRLSA